MKKKYLYHFYAVIEDANIGRIDMSGLLPLLEKISTENYIFAKDWIWEQIGNKPDWATRDKFALRSFSYLHEEPVND